MPFTETSNRYNIEMIGYPASQITILPQGYLLDFPSHVTQASAMANNIVSLKYG